MNDRAACPFCAIIAGSRHADVLFTLEEFSVFRPMGRQAGKVLLVPHAHYERLDAMPEALLERWMVVAAELSVRLQASAYRLQVSCGAEAQNVRHLYAQFTYQVGPCPAE